jgi:uncharacterized membrane protein
MRPDHFFALVDGVMAIAMTIIVFDLRLPQELGKGELGDALWAMRFKLMAYVIGFLQAFAAWSSAHRLAHRVRAIDQWMVVVLGTSLLTISLVPFSTAVLARAFQDTDDLRVAMTLVTIVGGTSTGLFLFATFQAHRRGFLADGTTAEQVHFGAVVGSITMAGWVIALGLSFVAPWLALPLVVWGYAIALLPLRIDEFPVVDPVTPAAD